VTFSVNGHTKESSDLVRPPFPALNLFLGQNGLTSPEQLFGNSINEFGQSQVCIVYMGAVVCGLEHFLWYNEDLPDCLDAKHSAINLSSVFQRPGS